MHKQTKVQANYRVTKSARVNCGTCTRFRPPNRCELVMGIIRRRDVCDYWAQLGKVRR